MPELRVELEDRSYSIFIGSDILGDAKIYRPYVEGSQIMVVTNTTVDALLGSCVDTLFSFVDKLDKVVLPDGEQYKNLQNLNAIFDQLLKRGHNRKTTLVAVGGGVIGDMTGFAAACYQRGVSFIQVPTTLLSQVDSSVGGKTGVNHALGKNMIGAFHQPKCVVIDTAVLNSLPQRELSAGLAEVIKYGLIADSQFFEWLEHNIANLAKKDSSVLAAAIEKSCQIKASIVAKDEKESGVRAILNLGHTFGHAIEAHQGYDKWLHGEAVAAGIMMACEMSSRLGWLSKEIVVRAKKLIESAGLPTAPPTDITPDIFLKYMSVDKKVLDKTLRLVLLKGCGQAVVTSDFPESVLLSTLGNSAS